MAAGDLGAQIDIHRLAPRTRRARSCRPGSPRRDHQAKTRADRMFRACSTSVSPMPRRTVAVNDAVVADIKQGGLDAARWMRPVTATKVKRLIVDTQPGSSVTSRGRHRTTRCRPQSRRSPRVPWSGRPPDVISTVPGVVMSPDLDPAPRRGACHRVARMLSAPPAG